MAYLISALITLTLAIAVCTLGSAPYDVTRGQIFDISPGSQKILATLDKPLVLKYFAPFSSPELSAEKSFYIKRIEAMLRFYQKHQPLVKVVYVDTYYHLEGVVDGKKSGLHTIVTPLGKIYWGLHFTYGDATEVMANFDVQDQSFLELEISGTILGLTMPHKPKMTVISAVPVFGKHQDPRFSKEREWLFVRDLRKTFDVFEQDVTRTTIDPDTDLLLVIGDQGFVPDLWRSIATYLVGGGPTMIVVDPFCRVCAGQNGQKPDSELQKLLELWGVTYDSSLMVGDPTRSSRVQSVGMAVDYPFYMNLKKEDVAKGGKSTNHIDSLYFAEGGFFKSRPVEGLELMPLVQTTAAAASVKADLANVKSTLDLSKSIHSLPRSQHLLSLVLTGTFPIPAGVSTPGKISKSSLFLLADIDMLHDQNATVKHRAGERLFLKPKNDNISLLVDAAQLLAGDVNLIAIPSRDDIFFGLEEMAGIRAQSANLYQSETELIKRELDEVESRLAEILLEKHDRSEDSRKALESLQKEEILLIEKLSLVSAESEKVRQRLIFAYKVVQLFLVPMALLLAMLLWRRRQVSRLVKLLS